MKLLNRIQLLWKDTKTGRHEEGEPGEARIRALVLGIAVLVGPPLLLLLYYKTMFIGLTNADALDYAQLGRNLSAGRGFMTDILRPLALSHGNNPLQQPDVTHGPLFPFLLALSFGVFGAKDAVAVGVSGLFYLLTIPVVYFLGVRVFNRAVGLLTALIFTLNALLLEYATSGLSITLYVFLMTSLLLVMFQIASYHRDQATSKKAGFPKGQYLLAGLLTGLLYLTDPIFFWVVLCIGIAIFRLSPVRKGAALTAFLAPLCLLMLPWMARNMALTGNPVFGLRGTEIWMYTKGHYPGYLAYRELPSDLSARGDMINAVIQKVLVGVGQVIQAFPQVTASWVLAFFLPCLLFRFTDEATNVLRRVMMYCFLVILVGSLLFHITMPLFVCVIPTMLVLSVAYLLHLTEQAKLSRGSLALVTALIALAACFPLISDMTLIDKTPRLKEADAALAFARVTRQDEVCLSDQPWIVAWYADRPALWLPAEDAKVGDMRQRFPKARWLFLTDNARSFSPAWQYVYDSFARWNVVYQQATTAKKPLNSITIKGKGVPLFEALDGFSSVALGKDSTPSVVIATVPEGAQKLGMRTDNNGPTGD